MLSIASQKEIAVLFLMFVSSFALALIIELPTSSRLFSSVHSPFAVYCFFWLSVLYVAESFVHVSSVGGIAKIWRVTLYTFEVSNIKEVCFLLFLFFFFFFFSFVSFSLVSSEDYPL